MQQMPSEASHDQLWLVMDGVMNQVTGVETAPARQLPDDTQSVTARPQSAAKTTERPGRICVSMA